MAWELRELQGNIFDNQYKENERQPDKKGDFLLNGRPHEIAIWIKQGPKGPFLGFKISEKRLKTAEQSLSEQAVSKIRRPDDRITSGLPRNGDMNDDIPF